MDARFWVFDCRRYSINGHRGCISPPLSALPAAPRVVYAVHSGHPMVRWCHSIDADAARAEINAEIVLQGWHLLSVTSTKANKAIAVEQKRNFVSYLARTYPTAAKGADSWLQFIKTTMGVLKEWQSVSSAELDARRVNVHCVCACTMGLVWGAV